MTLINKNMIKEENRVVKADAYRNFFNVDSVTTDELRRMFIKHLSMHMQNIIFNDIMAEVKYIDSLCEDDEINFKPITPFSSTKQLLDMICEKGFENYTLSSFCEAVSNKFIIDYIPFIDELVTIDVYCDLYSRILEWEAGNKNASLEKTINNIFLIHLR